MIEKSRLEELDKVLAIYKKALEMSCQTLQEIPQLNTSKVI